MKVVHWARTQQWIDALWQGWAGIDTENDRPLHAGKPFGDPGVKRPL